MASAEELLAAMSEPGEDERVILTIDENLRIVTIPSVALVIGAKGDKDVNRIWFKINRYYRGTDLEGFVPKIYYTNAAGERYYYEATDAGPEGDCILFSWLIGRKAVTETGTVEFGVCMQRLNGSTVEKEFNTTTAVMQCLKSACDGEAERDGPAQSATLMLGSSAVGHARLG